jgi:hypothetical protein
MNDELPMLTRIYYAAYVILLTCIALLSISIAFVAIDTRDEVTRIRLILENDYEYVSETTQ